jgi:exodeoxyribonuclease VII large subunit
MDKCADVLDEMSARLMQGVRSCLLWEHRRIENLAQRIPSVAYKRIADAKYDLLSAQRDLQMASRQFLSAKKHRLELLQQRLNDALPEKQLARGYSITLKNGKAVKDASLLKEGDTLVTMLHRGRIESEVKKK